MTIGQVLVNQINLQIMNVVQSYLTTIMHGKFTLYEIRIFVKIVEHANHVLRGSKISRILGTSVCVDGVNCNLSIPVKSVMTDGSHDYVQVKQSLQSLLQKKVEVYNPDEKVWKAATLINNIRVAEGDGLIKFVVPKWLMEYILNFVYGNFSEYNLQAALSLPSAYAVRLYWLTCSMTRPISYPIKMLREMLGVGDKYKMTKDFIKRTIEPARKLLEDRKLNGYNFTKGMTKGKCTYITFTPIKREEQTKQQLTAQASVSAFVDPGLRQYLTTQCGFSMRELSSNKSTLMEFCKLPDWADQIVDIVERQRKKRRNKGYVINAMKSCVNEHKPAATMNQATRQAINGRKLPRSSAK